MPLEAKNSPFDHQQVDLLNRLLGTLTPEQMVWLGGYLAGVCQAVARAAGQTPVASAPAAQLAPALEATPLAEVTIVYASQTGNAIRLSGELSRRLEARGFRAALSSMSDFRPSALKKVGYLLVVASTHGEGDPPDNAVALYQFLHSKRAPKLEHACFSVLALGDLSYEHFCKIGKDFDSRLEELGARRLHPRVDCDVDYDEAAEGWMEGVLAALSRSSGVSADKMVGRDGRAALPAGAAGPPCEPEYSRSRPFPAEVLESLCLNGRGSDKQTQHLELSLEGSGLAFEPGDSLGIYPHNHPELVDDLIRHMRWNPQQPVPAAGGERPLREALIAGYEITVLTRPLLEHAAEFSRDGLKEFLRREPQAGVQAYMRGRDLLDLARDFSLAGAPAVEFVPRLRKLPPRLYSIASSHRANPDEAHLAVSAVRYRAHQRERTGVCSVFCIERVAVGETLAVYVNSNPNFRLPGDGDAPLVMIGPGTGVAPFRAFLEEREETGARGKSWLFFGDRHFRTDFLYQLDWQRWRKRGVLARMDVAFSRDTDRKVYAQHRMAEHARELYGWLEEGAYVYVCGDKDRMAGDVHAALEKIVQSEGGKSREEAAAYLAELQRQKRYQRDVY